jgi:hypothetical protein
MEVVVGDTRAVVETTEAEVATNQVSEDIHKEAPTVEVGIRGATAMEEDQGDTLEEATEGDTKVPESMRYISLFLLII